jgi:hypothetical protein
MADDELLTLSHATERDVDLLLVEEIDDLPFIRLGMTASLA